MKKIELNKYKEELKIINRNNNIIFNELIKDKINIKELLIYMRIKKMK